VRLLDDGDLLLHLLNVDSQRCLGSLDGLVEPVRGAAQLLFDSLDVALVALSDVVDLNFHPREDALHLRNDLARLLELRHIHLKMFQTDGYLSQCY
jgi:hypothetical protein